MKIQIVSTSLIKKNSNVQWLYVGKNHKIYSRMVDTFGAERLFIKPEILYSCVIEKRKNIIAWMDSNLADQFYDRWMAVSFLKNPFMSDFVLFLVYLSYIKENIEKVDDHLVVASDSYWFSKTLYNHLKNRGYDIEINSEYLYYGKLIKEFLKEIAVFIFQIMKITDRFLFSKIILGSAYGKKIRLHDPEILIDTYLHDNSFDQNGIFKERYFPGLYEYYEKHGFKVAICPWLFVKGRQHINIYRKMKNCSTYIILPEYFLKFTDIAKTALNCLFASACSPTFKSLKYEGIDIKSLTNSYKLQIAFNLFTAKILHRAPKRLRQHGLFPKILIEWYENQPLDKASISGFGKVFEKLKIIACIQYFPGINFFSLFSGTKEIQSKASPMDYGVMGNALKTSFFRLDETAHYTTIPALRYNHVYRQKKETKSKHIHKTLLVILPHSVNDSVNILELMYSSINIVKDNFEKIIIRLHPDMELKDFLVQNGLERLKNEKLIHWSNSALYNDFNNSSLVVTTGSSAALESIAYGLPVIIIGEKFRLTMNPLEDIDQKLWRVVFQDLEFQSVIRDWWSKTNFNEKKYSDYAKAVKRSYFEEATEENMKKFLEFTKA